MEADEITVAMVRYGWDAFWFANPVSIGPIPADLYKSYGPRWHVGLWTGPDRDLICVRECTTAQEAQKLLSPAGWTPLDAVKKAIQHYNSAQALAG